VYPELPVSLCFCFVFLRLVYPELPISEFFILVALSVFTNVYLDKNLCKQRFICGSTKCSTEPLYKYKRLYNKLLEVLWHQLVVLNEILKIERF
jgi:hypothetical protein